MFGTFLAKKLFSSDNSTSRELKSRHKALSRRKSRKAMFESLEDRRVLAGFVPGSIQGQEGWSGGTIAISPAVDQAVDQTGANAHSGVGSWHISNQAYNGNFSGWPFGPGLTVSAGQPSSGAPADLFTSTYYFKSANTVADGSNIEMDLGTVPGDDRNTFLAVTNNTNANGGLQLRMAEPDGVTGGFQPTQIVATNLTRNAWHRIDITAKFYNGAGNDTFEVKLDGVSMINPNAASPNFNTPIFNTFEGYRDGNGFPYALSNRLFFRSGAAASAFDGSFTNAGAQGFYFDDMTYQAALQSNPSSPLAIYSAGFESQPSIVYVDDSWVGTTPGNDPDGAGPATSFGNDSFATVQGGVTAVAIGGTVKVYAGSYPELVNVNKQLTLLGAQAGVDARDVSRTGLPATESVLSGNAGTTSFIVTASNVSIDGFTVQNQTDVNQFGAGIVIGAGTSGAHIVNDIVQNNIIGISLANAGASQAVIQHNVIRNNNQPGASTGTGIYTDQFNAGGTLSNVLIDANIFSGNNDAGIDFSSTDATKPATGIVMSGNEFNANARAMLAFNLTNSQFVNNSVLNSTAASTADLRVFEGVNNFTITNNILQGGAGRAMRVNNLGTGSPNAQNVTFQFNSISGYTGPTDTVQVDAGGYTGTLNAAKNWWGAISGPTSAANPGGLGATMTPSGISFAPWLIYGTDANPAANGFQLPTVVPVTSGGDVSPADNDFRRLQNAIGAAVAGQTIDIHGAFNWTLPNSSASYAASISDSDTADLRGVEIPDGVNNLTITSSTTDAHITGSGDAAGQYDSFAFTDDSWSGNGGPNAVGNTNLIIEKLNIDNFESAIMEGWNSTGIYNGTRYRNNTVSLAGDDDAAFDVQNIAFYLTQGTGQQITGNIVNFQGDGTNPNGPRSFGFQNSTTGGALYDNLLIDGNTFQLATTSTGLENVYGVWENSHNDDNSSDIAISNNQFLGRTGIDLFDRALVLSSQTTGLLVDANTFTDVDNVLYMTNSAGPSPGDTFSFTNNVLTRVGGADGIFLSNTTTGPVQIITNWNTNNTIDGFTGVRGLNELSVQATGSSRPTGAASVLGDVNGVGPRPAVFVDDNWGAATRFSDPDGIGTGLGPMAFGFNTYTSIATAIAAVQAGGDVNIRTGTYTENLDTSSKNVTILPGASPGQVTINGNMVLDSNDTLTLELDGTNPATQFDNFIVNGDVTLGGATLNLIINQNPAGGSFRIIDNTGANPVSGIFAGHADDSTFFVSGIPVTIDYTGGTGNDVVLFIGSPALVYVNDNWVITTDVGPAGLSTGDTVANTGAGDDGTVTAAYGYNAFTTVQQGVDAVAATGTVRVLHNAGGSYNEDVTINKVLVFNGQTVTLGAGNKFILVAGESVTGSTGIVAPTVDVNAGAKINDGILLVASGGTVNVSAGTFAENVVVPNKTLTLKGAQFGVDARGRVVGAPNPAVETVVAPAAGRPLELQANPGGVIVDGFSFVGSLSGAVGVIESTTGNTHTLQLRNNYVAVAAGFNASALFLNKSALDASIDKNVFLASATSSQSVIFDGPDAFHGMHFTNNNVVRSGGISGTGLFVDGNHNVSNIGSVGTPLFKGNLFQGFATGVNIGSRSFDNGEISENTFTGNTSNGLQGGPQHTQVLRNTFNNTGVGIALTSFGNLAVDRGAQLSTISENVFLNNATADVVFSATQAPGTISSNTLVNNSLGSAIGVSYAGAEIIRASGNWWGANTNPEFTGTKISGAGAANVDYSPWLNSGTDTNLVTPGFQGDFSYLNVDDDSPISAQNGGVARIQEGSNTLADGALVGAARIVDVKAGTYNELVAANKSATFRGAQAGVDARTRGVVPESIVSNGDGDFQILADNVTIDGFTLQGVTNNPSVFPFTGLGAAIWSNPGFSGTQGGHQIRNNIIQGNIVGIELANTGVFQTVVERNLIQNNNAPGPGSGDGIRGDFSLDNALIDNNTFINHSERGILIFGATNSTFSNNSFDGRGIGVGGGSNLTFTSNTMNGGGATGISLTAVTGTVNITGNNISGKTTTGIRALGSGSGTVTLDNNVTTGNADAIDIEDYTTVSLINHASSGNTTGGILADITNVNFTTTNASETVDVDGMAHTIDNAVIQPITYSNVTNLNVFTLGGDDTISVIAPNSGDTIISVDGGPHSLGDSLVYDNTGAAFTVNPTSITSPTRQTVNYVNIENLLISSVIVAGTNGDDVLTLSFVSNSPYTIQYVLNGGAPVVLTGVSSFVFNAGLGDDTMIVDLASGDAIPPSGVFYNGEGQTGGLPYPLGDVLQVKLGGKNATYTPGSTTGNVTVNVPTDGLITATGLEPVDLFGGGTVTVVGIPVTGANDLWTVANGFDSATGATPALVVTGTSGGTPIESVHLWNNTNVVLDTTTVAGTDTVTVASGNNAHGNTNLTIKTGAQAGDIVNFNGVLTLAGNLNVDTSAGVANVNAAINAALITGNLPLVNVDDAPSGQIQDGVDLAAVGATVNVLAGTYAETVTVNKNLTIDGAVNGSGDPNSIVSPVAGNAMTIVSPVTTMTLSDLSLVAPAGGSALLANLGGPGTVLNLTNLNSSGAAGGSVSNWNTINFTTNDNANTVYVTGVASSGLSTSPLAGKAAQKVEVNGKLIPLGWATTANGTLNVDVKNGDDIVSGSPSTSTFINLKGGPHTAGDKLNLDMSGTTPVVIVDGAGGNADSASTKTLHFSEFEQLCVFDPVLTSTVLGDFYLRGTDLADYIQFVSAAQVNPVFRVRVGNIYYPTNGGSYGPYTTSGPGASKLFVYGRGGNDTITMYNTRVDAAFFGEDGDDIITGGYGNDLLVGGQGADRINGGSVGGNDEVWGDDFNPALDTPSVASQTTSGGNDQINTFGGNDTVYGQAGADIINTGLGADYISGGAGGDLIDGQGGDDRIYAGAGDDTASGSDGNDIVAGNGGNDTLFGRLGNDILVGGIGLDTVNGNEGSDALVGDESSYTGQSSNSLAKGDAADAALLALMALWGPSPLLADLLGFGSAGPDGSTDTLWGGAAADAFFGAPPDNAADRNATGYGPDMN